MAKLEERERIAMELHDSVIQSLYGITLTLAAHERTLGDVGGATNDVCRQVRDQISDIIQDIRGFIVDLRVHEIGVSGLTKGLEALADELRTNTLIAPKPVLETDTEGLLSKEATYHVLQIVREATSNIIRHAHATEVTIRATREDGTLIVTIRDDGSGFDPHARVAQLGKGLNNMRRRAELLGGHLIIRSVPGNGANIRLEVPLCGKNAAR